MKKFLAFLLAAAMILSLAACAKTPADPTDPEPPLTDNPGDSSDPTNPPAEETIITIPSYMVGENAGAVYFEPAVERFNAQNAGTYKILLEEVTEADYFAQMSRLAQTGNLPLIVCGAPSTTADFVDTVLVPNNFYYPMNDFLASHPEIAALCLDSSTQYSTLDNGDIVGLPSVYVPTVGLFYNDALYTPSKPDRKSVV